MHIHLHMQGIHKTGSAPRSSRVEKCSSWRHEPLSIQQGAIWPRVDMDRALHSYTEYSAERNPAQCDVLEMALR